MLATIQSVLSKESPVSSMVRYSGVMSSLDSDSLREIGQVTINSSASFESKAPVTV